MVGAILLERTDGRYLLRARGWLPETGTETSRTYVPGMSENISWLSGKVIHTFGRGQGCKRFCTTLARRRTNWLMCSRWRKVCS